MHSLSDLDASVSPLANVTQGGAIFQPPTLWRLLCAWLSIGAQSFGGGSSTLFLIRRIIVERRGPCRLQQQAPAWRRVRIELDMRDIHVGVPRQR